MTKEWFDQKSAELAEKVLEEVRGVKSINEAAFIIDRAIQTALREAYDLGLRADAKIDGEHD